MNLTKIATGKLQAKCFRQIPEKLAAVIWEKTVNKFINQLRVPRGELFILQIHTVV